jgi:hypothetical protein
MAALELGTTTFVPVSQIEKKAGENPPARFDSRGVIFSASSTANQHADKHTQAERDDQ